MGRGASLAPARLRAAAVELYARDGFAETTVGAIASSAGVTERTFFRHFADKREVLFGGSDELAHVLHSAVVDAGDVPTREAALAGLAAVVEQLQPRRAELVTREAIVRGHAELRERELAKLAAWTTALYSALRERGAEDIDARTVAAVAVAALNVAAAQWLDGDGSERLDAYLGRVLERARLLA